VEHNRGAIIRLVDEYLKRQGLTPGERGYCFGGWDDVPFEPPLPWPDVYPADSCARWEHIDDPNARDCTVPRKH
jgi:hypothetical protein